MSVFHHRDHNVSLENNSAQRRDGSREEEEEEEPETETETQLNKQSDLKENIKSQKHKARKKESSMER